MNKPKLSRHFESRKPSAIRVAQIEFAKRKDDVEAINTAIGNVSLPTHKAIQKRLFNLNAADSPFRKGVVKYTPSVGMKEANKAFLNIIASSGFKTDNLYSVVTDGGSQAMELVLLGVCGPPGSSEHPILLIDPAYTNYNAFASRLGRKTVSVQRNLQNNGKFTLPDIEEIEKTIEEHKPGALLVIPYDNPTGQFYDIETMITLGKLCVKHNLWMISDEAYRELHYGGNKTSSIWGLTNDIIPGVEGRRVCIETASKVWNGCGLRIGAFVTDNKDFYEKSLAEYTANLCANAIGQYAFGALAHVSHKKLNEWYRKQREYYKPMMFSLRTNIEKALPGIIVSSPDATLYSIVDVRNIAKPGFNSSDFVLYCARRGTVKIDSNHFTLLVAPMSEFYNIKEGEENPGDTQMRVAFVEDPEKMKLVPILLKSLFLEYEQNH